MGNTQTVGRKHHHNTHTKKQGRHNIVRHTKGRHTKGRHTKGRRRHRYYQRGGKTPEELAAEKKAAEAAAPAAEAAPDTKALVADAAPAANAADTKAPAADTKAPAVEEKKTEVKCNEGCQPIKKSIIENITSSPEKFAKNLETDVTGFFGNQTEKGKEAVGQVLSNAGNTLKGLLGNSAETKLIVAETKVGGKRKRKTNKRRKHKKA